MLSDLFEFMGVDDEFLLAFPVELFAGPGELEVALPRPPDPLDDIGRMGGDAGSDKPFPDVLDRGQAEVLGGRDMPAAGGRK